MPSKKAAKRSAAAALSPLVPPLRALLHTMRCIAQHEDRLCTLLHTVQSSPAVSEELRTELRDLLEQLPSGDYTDDLHALDAALLEPGPLTKRKAAKS